MKKLAILASALSLAACAQGGASLDSGNVFGSTLVPPATQQRTETAAYHPQVTRPLKPAPRADNLIGLDGTGIVKSLGKPIFQRTEPGAEIWRYNGEACTLFVYFYEDEMDTLRAAYIDARAATGGDTQPDPCIASVSKAFQLSAERY